MSTVPLPLTILRALAEETRQRLELAPQIEHPGESGRAREQMLITFITQLIPSSFGVSTGFIVDALGEKSKQIDVVVYRTDYAPILEIGGVKHFLVESVVAALEVKAAVDSEVDLTRALDNIASVKALDRSNRGENFVLTDREPAGKVDRDDAVHQVFGAVVTENSLAESFGDRLYGWLRSHSRHTWPNLYVDVHQHVVMYGWEDPSQPSGQAVGTNAMLAEKLVIPFPAGAEPPLVMLGFELINWFRVVPTIDFAVERYFPLTEREHYTRQLPPA